MLKFFGRSAFIGSVLFILMVLFAAPSLSQTANGRATTAPPTYADGQSAPLSLDTSGNLRVIDAGGGGGVQQVEGVVATGAPASGNTVRIGGVYNNPIPVNVSGDAVDLQVDDRGNVRALFTASTSSSVTDNLVRAIQPVSIAANQGVASGWVSFMYAYDAVGQNFDRVGISGQNLLTEIGAALPAGTNNIGDVDVLSLPSLPAGVNNIGDVDVASLPALPAGTNNIGDVDVATLPPITLAVTTQNHSAIMAATTNSTLVKNSAGVVYEISVYNETDTIAWLKLYDASSAPTCGSGTPAARYMIPGAASGGAGSNVNISLGKTFATGIAYCVTGGIADADTTAVTANDYVVNISYE